jgi:soluble P-type ATPase
VSEALRALGVLVEPPGPKHAAIGEALELPPPPSADEHMAVIGFQLPPYGSIYLGAEGMVGGEARDRVAGFWRALGAAPPREPDHLSVLCAALAALAAADRRTVVPAVDAAAIALADPTDLAARDALADLTDPRRAVERSETGGGDPDGSAGGAGGRAPRGIEGWIAELAERGETPIVVGCDGAMVAVAGLADPIRDDARDALDALARLGWDVQLLSGDDERVVRRVGGALGVPWSRCHGQVSPEDKVTAVVQARRHGPVAMVGDGVNDAAAMAAASAGIAVSGAAEIAIEAADVYLRSPSITAIAATAAGARDTLATIRRNLKFSLAYNLVAGALAVTGLIHPLVAAAVMPLSSLTVLASSLRSRAFRDPIPRGSP